MKNELCFAALIIVGGFIVDMHIAFFNTVDAAWAVTDGRPAAYNHCECDGFV